MSVNISKIPLLTDLQRQTLGAIADTFIAALRPDEEEQLIQSTAKFPKSQISLFSKTSGTSIGIVERIEEKLKMVLTLDQLKDFLTVLNVLSYSSTSLLLTGHLKPFKNLTRQEREIVLLKWKRSPLATIRRIYNSLMGLVVTEGYFGTNTPLFHGLEYPGILGGQTYFINQPDYDPVKHEKLHQLTTEQALGNTWFDAIVVGSGAGGGVMAAELAKAGMSVLVVEKGKYFLQEEMPEDDHTAFNMMYENCGISPNTDGTVNILSGSTFGGGTTINYLASLKPPAYVKKEWSNLGLGYFRSEQFENDLSTVYEKIGASTDNISHSIPNQKLIEGCRKLGYHVADVPQNTSGKSHHCGKCYTGCKSGVKNSATNSWLKDAHAYGAKFLDQSRVNQILIKDGKAAGILCNVHGIRDHIYRANHVIIAAGALHTPSLLIKSGLRNPHIGQHLRLHLSSLCVAIYDEDTNPCQGALLTAVSNEFENFDGENHGFKIECFTQGLGLYAGMVSWEGAEKHKELLLRYRNAVVTFALMRDKDSKCSVRYDSYGKHDIQVSISEHDILNLKEGVVQMSKIHVAAGARQIHVAQHSIKPFVFKEEESSDIENPRFKCWLNKIYKMKHPIPSSGHQMGSCCMGVSPKTSAVQPTGETWDVKNLYVADSSLFPTALGVNPMVTIQSIALAVSRNVVNSFKNQKMTADRVLIANL